MKDQHEKIKGYRNLSQNEIDLMNQIKEKASEVGRLVDELQVMRADQSNELRNGNVAIGLNKHQLQESRRAASISKTKLQTGFMWLVRAVALPDSF